MAFSKKSHSRGEKPTPYALRPTPFLWGVASIFGFIRPITIRARAFYERRYKKHEKEPLSRIVFIFDVVLVVVIGLLLVSIISVSLQSFNPSFNARFQTSAFLVASPTPVAVSVRVAKGSGLHRNVRAFWKVPSGIEVIESNPRILTDGSVYLGNLSSDQEVRLHLIVRAYKPVGEKVTIGLQLQEGGLFDIRTTYVSTNSMMSEGGLFAEIPLDIGLAKHVVAKGAVIPIRIVNQTDQIVPAVELRPTESSSIQFSRQSIGDLAPHEERFIMLPLGDLTGPPTLGWSLVASSFEVTSSTWHADLMEWPNVPEIQLPALIKQNATTTLSTTDGIGSSLVVISTALNPSMQSFAVDEASKKIALRIQSSKESGRLYSAPVRMLENGNVLLGSATLGLIAGELPLKTSIRYTSASGDQIGVGAHPPKQNEETRYWVFFTVEQPQISLKNIHVKAVFPKGVELTGLIAVPDGGSWTTSRQLLDWKLPVLASSRASVMIGAEISITPATSSTDPYALVSSVFAEATDVNSDVTIEKEQGSMTTEDVDRN